MYNKDELEHVELKEYLQRIIASFSYIDIELNIDGIEKRTVPSSAALNLGLVLVEMITCSIKQQFGQEQDVKITIAIDRHPTEYHLLYSDNGSGIPAELTPREGGSFGFDLINTLIMDIEGEWVVEQGDAFSTTLILPTRLFEEPS